MPLDLDDLLSRRVEGRGFGYTDTQMLLYNLGVGMGRDPSDPRELPFVFERPALRVVPTAASVLGGGGARLLDGTGIDWTRVLHGEQRLTIHRPLPASAALVGDSRVAEVVDKGAKGAVITIAMQARLDSGEPLYSTENVIFARGDGGFGGPAASERPPLPPLPERAPDHVHVSETRPDQALLYRLNGDRNPLHADPAFAAKAGFPRPILHGLCSYGIACRAVLATVCGYDPARMTGFDARFTAPVFPGETLHTDIWLENGAALFRSRVDARGINALNGLCRFVS